VVAKGLLVSIAEKSNYVPIFLNFSAQTSSIRTQEMIEAKLEKKRKNILGRLSYICFGVKFPPLNLHCLIFHATLEPHKLWHPVVAYSVKC